VAMPPQPMMPILTLSDGLTVFAIIKTPF
jgi:hypothetical protein